MLADGGTPMLFRQRPPTLGGRSRGFGLRLESVYAYAMKPRCATSFLIAVALLANAATLAADRADPIGPPPEDRSTLPPVRQGVVMVQVQKVAAECSARGWGGMRLIQAKTDPVNSAIWSAAVKRGG